MLMYLRTVLLTLIKDRKGIDGFVVTAGLLALAAGITVLAMPAARTSIVNMWSNVTSGLSTSVNNIAAGK
jgi:uncharacterized membrane protein HdeD (DUF308 family)